MSTTAIGNVITYWPEIRGSRALDGNVDTAWEVGDHGPVIGEMIRIDLDHSTTTDQVNLVQPLVGPRDRYITKATLKFDGNDPVTVDLADSSRTPQGQTVRFPRRTFDRFEVTIDDTNVGDTFDYPTSNNVGFAEIRLRDDAPGAQDLRSTEIVRMPTDLVDAAGPLASARPLVYEMSRSRNVVIPPRYSQDEEAMVRKFRVPDTRAFSLGGTVRLSTAAPDDVLDAVLGVRAAEDGGITVHTSQHLPGDVRARGSSAVDGDRTTAWSTAFGDSVGQWVQVQTPSPVTFDHLDLALVADGRHSVPTQLRIDAGGESRTVDVGPVTDRAGLNATASVPVSFPQLTGSDVRVTVTAIRPMTTIEYHENQPIVMPVGIAELGIPGVMRPPMPAQLPSECRTDLLSVDGAPVALRLSGGTAEAQRGEAVDVEPSRIRSRSQRAITSCGRHRVRRPASTSTAWCWPPTPPVRPVRWGLGGRWRTSPSRSGALPAGKPDVHVVDDGRTNKELRISGAEPGVPFWLVLGESNSKGWKATVANNVGSVLSGPGAGRSTLVDGYANGWLVVPELPELRRRARVDAATLGVGRARSRVRRCSAGSRSRCGRAAEFTTATTTSGRRSTDSPTSRTRSSRMVTRREVADCSLPPSWPD